MEKLFDDRGRKQTKKGEDVRVIKREHAQAGEDPEPNEDLEVIDLSKVKEVKPGAAERGPPTSKLMFENRPSPLIEEID